MVSRLIQPTLVWAIAIYIKRHGTKTPHGVASHHGGQWASKKEWATKNSSPAGDLVVVDVYIYGFDGSAFHCAL